MDRPLALILTFLAFMAYVHHINAGIVKLNALPSRSLPVYSTKNEALGISAFVQEDGWVTFVRSTGISIPRNFSCMIDSYHRGRAYAILGVQGDSVRLLSVVGTNAFGLVCSAFSKVCEATFPIVPLPIFDKSPVLAIEPCEIVPDQVFLATVDTFLVLSLSAMAPLTTFTWTGKPFISQYHLDTVSIVQGRPEVNGHPVLVVLSSKQSGWQAPGVALSLRVADLGRSVRLRSTTFFDSSPTNMHIPLGFNIYYWTQFNRNDSSIVYVNSVGGWPHSPTLTLHLQRGSSLSPSCFGEYPMTSVGLICAGDVNTTQTMYGLHLAYGQGLPPEITQGQTYSSSLSAGALQWAVQPSRLTPLVYGVARLADGSLVVESFDFGNMGMGTANRPSHSQKNHPNTLTDAMKTQSAPAQRRPSGGSSHSSANPMHRLPVTAANSAPNCVPSNCAFDEPGDCPPEHCWVFGGNGHFMCCMKPPI